MTRDSRVSSYTRKGRVVRTHNRKVVKRKKKKKKKLSKKKILVGSIGSAGVLSAGAVLVLRKRYKARIPARGLKAAKNSVNVKVPDLTEAELKHNHINFAIGGLGASDEHAKSLRIAREVKRRFKGHTVAVDTTSFNDLKVKKSQFASIANMYALEVRTLKKGYNPSVDELAATVLAYQKKYPKNTMVLHGHSFGGSMTNETLALVKAGGGDMSKIKQVTYGTSYYGVVPQASSKNSLHLVNNTDLQASSFGLGKGKRLIKKKSKRFSRFKQEKESFIIYGHKLSDYLGKDAKEAIGRVKEFISDPDYMSPVDVVKKTKKNNKQVNPLSKSRKELRFALNKLKKARRNKNIPEDKKKKILLGLNKQYKAKAKAYRQIRDNTNG